MTHHGFKLPPVGAAVPTTERLDGALHDAIEQIVTAWNESIPRNRVRVLTIDRHRAIREALRDLTVSQICEAIRFYGRQKWQRANNRWRKFDDWIGQDVVVWYEQAMDEAEADEARQHRREAAARQVERHEQQMRDEQARRAQRRRQWEALPEHTRRQYVDRAREASRRRLSDREADHGGMLLWAREAGT